MVSFYDIFYQLEGMGFFDVFLPFLLVFTIIYAILEKTFLFGKNPDQSPKSNINLIVALIIGLIVVVQTDLTFLINQYLSKMALFIIIALIFILTLGVFGGKPEEGFSGWAWGLAVIVSIIAVLWALTPSYYGPYGIDLPYWLYLTPESKSFLLVIGFFVLIISLVNKKPSGGKGFGKGFEDFMKGFKGAGGS